MKEDIYLHCLTASFNGYSSKKSLELLEKILKSKHVLSQRQRNEPSKRGFAGEDYICLCDYEKRNKTKDKKYNGYNQYAVYDATIAFPKDSIEVIKPIILSEKINHYPNWMDLMEKCGYSEERYTDLEDEVQVKDKISLDNMCGITLPTTEILNYWFGINRNLKILRSEVLRYKELLDKYGYFVPIVDVETLSDLENEEELYNVVQRSLKKR